MVPTFAPAPSLCMCLILALSGCSGLPGNGEDPTTATTHSPPWAESETGGPPDDAPSEDGTEAESGTDTDSTSPDDDDDDDDDDGGLPEYHLADLPPSTTGDGDDD